MNVWRGITLTLWATLLTACSAFAILYHSLDTTLLRSSTVKAELAKSGAYDTIRDETLTAQIMAALQSRYPDNRLIDHTLIQQTLAAVLPASTVQQRLDPAIAAVYRWLDSKEETLSFSIDLTDKQAAFYGALEKEIGKKMTALDSCGDYRFPPEEAILNDKCLPLYVTPPQATDAVMAGIKSGDIPFDTTITDTTLFGPSQDRGALNDVPSYLNILWTVNLVAVSLFVILAAFLVITRRLTGLIALGVSLTLGAIIAWFFSAAFVPVVSGGLVQVNALAKAIGEALLPSFQGAAMFNALIAALCGLAVAVIGFLWRQWSRRG